MPEALKRLANSGAVRMSNYRLYYLDDHGGIGLPEWFNAPDDQDAIRQARVIKPHARKCEIWAGLRLVAQMDAQAKQPVTRLLN
jgi:hypothetical protein